MQVNSGRSLSRTKTAKAGADPFRNHPSKIRHQVFPVIVNAWKQWSLQKNADLVGSSSESHAEEKQTSCCVSNIFKLYYFYKPYK